MRKIIHHRTSVSAYDYFEAPFDFYDQIHHGSITIINNNNSMTMKSNNM